MALSCQSSRREEERILGTIEVFLFSQHRKRSWLAYSSTDWTNALFPISCLRLDVVLAVVEALWIWSILCFRQLSEKCEEHNMPLYAVFIDFSKDFDTVFGKYWCTAEFINLTRALHNVMQAHVDQGSYISKVFAVTDFVKQGCVLAPTLFSLYLTAILKAAFDGVGDGIFIQTRTNADLFNVPLFKAKTRTT